jgi:hypothetical protein
LGELGGVLEVGADGDFCAEGVEVEVGEVPGVVAGGVDKGLDVAAEEDGGVAVGAGEGPEEVSAGEGDGVEFEVEVFEGAVAVEVAAGFLDVELGPLIRPLGTFSPFDGAKGAKLDGFGDDVGPAAEAEAAEVEVPALGFELGDDALFGGFGEADFVEVPEGGEGGEDEEYEEEAGGAEEEAQGAAEPAGGRVWRLRLLCRVFVQTAGGI